MHLYSFSKVFALTGYRVGGVTAGAALMAEIEKAMDCVSICPPRLGQEAALYGLRNLLPWARKNTEGLKARADLLGSGLARSNRWRLVSIGAYFAYVEHPFAGERSTAVSKRLADEENLLTIPGRHVRRGPGALRAHRLRQRERRQDPGRARTPRALRRLISLSLVAS